MSIYASLRKIHGLWSTLVKCLIFSQVLDLDIQISHCNRYMEKYVILKGAQHLAPAEAMIT